MARAVERLLQDHARHLPEADQALERGDIVDRHPELAAEAAQVFVGKEEDEEGNPISKKQPGPAEDQRRNQHQKQEPFGRYREVEDEDHEQRHHRQVSADQRWQEPGAPAGYGWTLRGVSRLHRKSLLKAPSTAFLKAR